MRKIVWTFLAAGLLPSSAYALGAYETLQRDIGTYGPVLEQNIAEVAEDAKERELDAQVDFFADDGRGEGAVREEDPELSKYVYFRIGGVPYVLRDVPVGQWFAPYVRDMAERGIVSGYKDVNGVPTGVFAPAQGVTLEELAKMAIEAAQVDKASCPAAALNPLAQASWSSQYIACAEGKGFVLFSDGTVNIARPATRTEVLVTVLQAFGVPTVELLPDEKIFTDVNASTLFAPAIKTAVKDGIVSGYADASGKLTGEFKPDNSINRAEVSKMLSIALQVYGR